MNNNCFIENQIIQLEKEIYNKNCLLDLLKSIQSNYITTDIHTHIESISNSSNDLSLENLFFLHILPFLKNYLFITKSFDVIKLSTNELLNYINLINYNNFNNFNWNYLFDNILSIQLELLAIINYQSILLSNKNKNNNTILNNINIINKKFK